MEADQLVEALNAGPPDYNTSALNHSATLPPVILNYFKSQISLFLPVVILVES